MRIVLCTVPHTGTTFFANLLRQHFKPVGFTGLQQGKQGFTACHATDSALANIRQLNDFKLVTTIREWQAVIDSFENRDRPLCEYIKHKTNHGELLKLNPIIVSIDDDRESRLRGLERELGVKFETDWKPANQYGR